MQKFADIIERVEVVRKQAGLNKSQFAASINMKPQTYNNFVGAQGSKPSIELIHGVIGRFGIEPQWLLNGDGVMHSGKAPVPAAGRSSQGFGSGAPFYGNGTALLRDVQMTLEQLQALLSKLRADLSRLELDR